MLTALGATTVRVRSRLVLFLLVAALVGSCSSSDDGGEATAPTVATADGTTSDESSSTSTSTSTSAPEPEPDPEDAPDEPGPFAVGRFTTSVTDPERDGRELTLDVVYPVEPGAVEGQPTTPYEIVPGVTVASPLAHLDAPVAAGPHPLVVFSHGSGGVRYQSYFLTEALASHGFVVAAPDHTGNTATDTLLGTPATFEQSAVDRPLDVSVVIDALLARSEDPADPLADAIDPDRIGVTGHSFGGYTALAVAGGAQDLPTDERIDAIAPIAPAAGPRLLDEAEIQAVDVPTLVVGGTADETTPIEPNSTRPFELVGAGVVRVDVVDAGHSSFTDICDLRDAIDASSLPDAIKAAVADQAEGGCADRLVPIEEAHRLTTRYVVSFFRLHLFGEEPYRSVLEDEVEGVTVAVRAA